MSNVPSSQDKTAISEQPASSTSATSVDGSPSSKVRNGDLRACLPVFGGVITSFSVFQTYYSNTLLRDQPIANISLIGSSQLFLLLAAGVVTGPLFDKGYFHALLGTGSSLIVFGVFMTSLCTRYWQMMLAQGLCVGLGCGCLFVLGMAIISTHFATRHWRHNFPVIFTQLQPSKGFRIATIVVASLMLFLQIICMVTMRARMLPAKRRRPLDFAALNEPAFLMFSLCQLFGFMGGHIPFFYLQRYAMDKQTATGNMNFYILLILNAGSVFGRIVPNLVADTFGPLKVYSFCALVTTVLGFLWIKVWDTALTVLFAILYGFFSGTLVSLPPAAVVSFSPDLSFIGSRMGISFGFAAVGVLIGNPVAGLILDNHGWVALQCFCGGCVLAATICSIVALDHETRSGRSARV